MLILWGNVVCFFVCYAILSQNLSCKGKVSDAKIKDFKNCKNGTLVIILKLFISIIVNTLQNTSFMWRICSIVSFLKFLSLMFSCSTVK